MASNAVAGFLPSRHGFRFANAWPAAPARTWTFGLVQVGLGDVGRGLCGGMVFAARDAIERGEEVPTDAGPPAPGTPLFVEIVDRQFDSFGPLFSVPLRFLLASLGSERRRLRESVRHAWPAIRAEIDGGTLAMVGLVRHPGPNVLARDFGHQVLAYRYEATRDRVAIGVYDPNHPGDDAVELVLTRDADGSIALSQSTGEALHGLLALPWIARSTAGHRATG